MRKQTLARDGFILTRNDKEIYRLEKKILIIQLFKRKKDLLPFIKYGLKVENDKIEFEGNIKQYIDNTADYSWNFEKTIPLSTHKNQEIDDELVKFKNVNVSYNGRSILRNINWTIQKGDFWEKERHRRNSVGYQEKDRLCDSIYDRTF